MADPTQEEIDAILDAEAAQNDGYLEALEEDRGAYAAWVAEQDALMGINDDREAVAPQDFEEPAPEPAVVQPGPREHVARRFVDVGGGLGDEVPTVAELLRERDPQLIGAVGDAEVAFPPRTPLPPAADRPDWSQLQQTPVLSTLTLPPDSAPDLFFGYYNVFASRPLGTCPEYNWATAAALISSMLGPGWRLETVGGAGDLAANLFVALVGASGTRKSLTAHAMRSCLPDVGLWTAVNPRSDVGFIDVLAEQSHRLWFLDEAGSLFKKLYTKSFEQMISSLTSLYDGQTTTVKGRAQEVTVENPYLTLVCCTIESGLLPGGDRSQVRELFTSGLLSRFMLCAAAERKDSLIHGLDQDAAARLHNWLMKRFLIAGNRPGRFKLAPEAWSQLRWYLESRGHAPVSLMGGTWRRAVTLAQKLSLIYHVAEGNYPNTPISAENLIRALRAVHYYVLPAHLYVARRALYTGVQILLDEVVQTLEAAPGGLTMMEFAALVGRDERRRYSALALLDNRIRYTTWTQKQRWGRGRPALVLSLISEAGDDADIEELVAARTAEGYALKCADAAPPRGVRGYLDQMDTEDIWETGTAN